MNDEPLIPLYPKGDFELRLFAEREVKDLKTEIGKLKAYIEELEDHVDKYKGNDPKWTDEEKMFIRRDEQVNRMKSKNKQLTKTIKSQKQIISNLIIKQLEHERQINTKSD